MFDGCNEEIERRFMEEDTLPFSSLNDGWTNKILNEEDEEIELLSKCENYRKTIEDDVKPLLNKLLIFNRKAEKATREPTEKLKKAQLKK